MVRTIVLRSSHAQMDTFVSMEVTRIEAIIYVFQNLNLVVIILNDAVYLMCALGLERKESH
jgi:hypothetical protein